MKAFGVVVLALLPAAAYGGEEVRFFETRVRPVLAEHCFSCHGPQKQRGGIRLDSRAGVLAEGEHGPIVVPGSPEKSFLLQAVRQSGEIKMPPKGKLPGEAIEALTAWIKMGAPWPETAAKTEDGAWKKHWAFQPVGRPAVPVTRDRHWPLSPVDAFVLAKLEEKGLRPAPAAEARVLIRRMYFDVIGLPPTAEEVERFVQDASAKPQAAIERVIEGLLASPHYGERWARHWLDVARYADTKGYVFFEEPDFPWAYTYRDYLIQALNADLPYDRFLLEQLAAEQLPLGADRRPLRALGLLTLGGRFMSNQHDILDDRIDVVTRGLLGLTVTCARCHDHKYDPVPQADYYALYGVFASCAEPTVPPLYEPPPATEVYTKFASELQTREQKLKEFVKAKHAELVTGARQRVAEYLLAAYQLRDQPSTEEFMLIADGSDLNPTMIIRWQTYLKRRARGHDPIFGPWHALAELPERAFAQDAAAVLAKVLADPARPVHPQIAKALTGMTPKNMAEVAQQYGKVLLAESADEELRQVFIGPDAPANVALLPYGDLSLLPDRPSQAKLQEFRKALEQWRSTGPGAPPRAMVLEDLPAPCEPYVFLRGNPNNKGPAVPRQFLGALSGSKRAPFRQGSGRLELARAIASRDNPLTARVMVNRVWQHYFGAGLVRTPSDFGLRSEPPSHPELLDYLASYFMDHGWSLKELHRLILRSRVYQQASSAEPQAMDPENRLLAHANRRRLDFEATRDALLAVAGRLRRTICGPSTKDLLGGGADRRTLYGYLDRLNVPGLWRTFDFPSPDATSPQREDTTIAPQALFLMNHPFVLACARQTAARSEIAAEKDMARRVEAIYRLLYGRAPAPEEVQLAREYLQSGGAARERYVHALLQANEFVWID